MSLRSKKDNRGFFFSCLGRPECNHAIWLADEIKEIKVLEQNCTKCQNTNKNIAIKFRNNNLFGMLNPALINDNDRTYVSCILCDNNLRVVLEVNDTQLRGVSSSGGGNHIQANNRAIPSQNLMHTNARPNVSNSTMPTNVRPLPNRTVPNPRPNANQTFRDPGDVQKCSVCGGPTIK